MIGAIIFAITFLGLLILTLSVPSLPLGNIIHDVLEIPPTDYLVLGIPSAQFINAIINGIVYGFILGISFSSERYLSLPFIHHEMSNTFIQNTKR